jgi:hypothetical protein
MVAHREHADLAERLIAETITKQQVQAGQLTLHADRGSSMTSKPVAFLLADLGVTKTHSRPHVSNDNPYSEAQFKTLKYRPGFPDRFASMEEARAFCQDFFRWYNTEHRHAGIGLLPPRVVHDGQARPPTMPAPRSSPPLAPPIPSASFARRRGLLSFRTLPGSARHRQPAMLRAHQRRCLSNFPRPAPQTY